MAAGNVLEEARERLLNSVPLADFMAECGRSARLSRADRLQIIDQAQVLLEMNYVHLPLKRAMHAVDPIQRLKRLRFELMEAKDRSISSDLLFYTQMQKVFISTRDIHTSFSLPDTFKDKTAYLPFMIEEYFARRGTRVEPRYLISHVVEPKLLSLHVEKDVHHESFRAGVEVLYWNGVPIRRAIEVHAETQAGSNPEARFARGLDAMTIRPLNTSLPPDEMWTVVTYRTPKREVGEVKLNWRVYASKPARSAARSPAKGEASLAIDTRKDSINQVKKVLFAPAALAAESRYRAQKKPQSYRKDMEKTTLPTVFRALQLRIGDDTIAYLRIFTFRADDIDGFVKEFARLLKRLQRTPHLGLILDVRGNGGGYIEAGERLLQFLTPRRIKPALFEFLNTPLNLEICRRAPKRSEFYPWKDSIAQAVLTGAPYSYALPISSEEDCNETGQIYYGPIVLVTDALCYSTTDIFAAGFQDHDCGVILGASGNTGAGGANVVKHKQLVRWLGRTPNSPFKSLPAGMSMSVALRRGVRVGKQAGRPLEEFGVVPDRRHYLTKDDLLHGNVDLILHAAELLRAKPTYYLAAEIKKEGVGAAICATTRNISRLDIYLGDRPYTTVHVLRGRSTKVTHIPLTGRAPKLKIEGYNSSGELIALLSKQSARRR